MTLIPLSRLSLYIANEGQILESRRRWHSHWARGLDVDQFVQSLSRIDATEIGVDNRTAIWVLARRDARDDNSFLCSSYRRPAIMCGVGGQVREAIGYGVTAVFTPTENRGKGYARHMMRLLHWVLAKEGSLNPDRFPEEWGLPPDRVPWVGDGSFSTLYSDLRADFYEGCGPYLAASATLGGGLDSGWVWFDEESVEDEKDKTKVAFLPTQGVARSQFDRRREHWMCMEPFPKYWAVGAMPANQTEGATNVSPFASWSFKYTLANPPVAERLLVTRLCASTDDFGLHSAHCLFHI